MKKILITLAFLLPLVAMAQTHVLRKGTQITLRSTQNAKASDLQIGEYLNFAVESPVEVDGNIVIPKGTRVSGASQIVFAPAFGMDSQPGISSFSSRR